MSIFNSYFSKNQFKKQINKPMYAYLSKTPIEPTLYQKVTPHKTHRYLSITNEKKKDPNIKEIKHILPLLKIKYEEYSDYLLLKDDVNDDVLAFLQQHYNLIMKKEFINEGMMRLPRHKVLFIKEFTFFENYFLKAAFVRKTCGLFEYFIGEVRIMTRIDLNKNQKGEVLKDVLLEKINKEKMDAIDKDRLAVTDKKIVPLNTPDPHLSQSFSLSQLNDNQFTITVQNLQSIETGKFLLNQKIPSPFLTQAPKFAEFFPCFVAKCKQNGIIYTWAPFYSMFSAGNISEKIRLSLIDEKRPVLDMFSGIGYLLLPFLRRGAPGIACEVNVYSVVALINNLRENKCNATVCFGDNREFLPVYANKCGRVLMGYIPDPQEYIPYAVAAIKDRGVIHYHTVLNKCPIEIFQKYALKVSIIHIERVKSYGKKMYHMVYDVFVEK